MLADDDHVDYAYKMTIVQHKEIEITTDLIYLYDYSKVDFSQTFFSDSLQNNLSFNSLMIIEHEYSILVSDTNDRK